MKVVQNKQPEVHLVQISLDGASSEGGFNHVTSCSKKRSAIGRGNFRSKISTNFPRLFSIWTNHLFSSQKSLILHKNIYVNFRNFRKNS